MYTQVIRSNSARTYVFLVFGIANLGLAFGLSYLTFVLDKAIYEKAFVVVYAILSLAFLLSCAKDLVSPYTWEISVGHESISWSDSRNLENAKAVPVSSIREIVIDDGCVCIVTDTDRLRVSCDSALKITRLLQEIQQLNPQVRVTRS